MRRNVEISLQFLTSRQFFLLECFLMHSFVSSSGVFIFTFQQCSEELRPPHKHLLIGVFVQVDLEITASAANITRGKKRASHQPSTGGKLQTNAVFQATATCTTVKCTAHHKCKNHNSAEHLCAVLNFPLHFWNHDGR